MGDLRLNDRREIIRSAIRKMLENMESWECIALSDIVAPRLAPERLEEYVRQGWIKEEVAEHVDRFFKRLPDGTPYLDGGVIIGMLNQYVSANKNKKRFWEQVKPRIEFAFIIGKTVLAETRFSKTAVTYECIPSGTTFRIYIRRNELAPEEVQHLKALVSEAGEKLGICGWKRRNFGRFIVLS